MNKLKLTDRQIEYWNTMEPFEKSIAEPNLYIVPPIPICEDEDYRNVIVPNLIRCGAIPKDELVVGKTYRGECRNASEATWDGERFTYQRYKFGSYYSEKINHFEDDNGFDVFVPMEEKKD